MSRYDASASRASLTRSVASGRYSSTASLSSASSRSPSGSESRRAACDAARPAGCSSRARCDSGTSSSAVPSPPTRRRGRRRPTPAAVDRQHRVDALPGATRQRVHPVGRALTGHRVQQLVEGQAQHLPRLPAEQLCRVLVPRRHAAVRVELDDGDGRAAHGQRVSGPVGEDPCRGAPSRSHTSQTRFDSGVYSTPHDEASAEVMRSPRPSRRRPTGRPAPVGSARPGYWSSTSMRRVFASRARSRTGVVPVWTTAFVTSSLTTSAALSRARAHPTPPAAGGQTAAPAPPSVGPPRSAAGALGKHRHGTLERGRRAPLSVADSNESAHVPDSRRPPCPARRRQGGCREGAPSRHRRRGARARPRPAAPAAGGAQRHARRQLPQAPPRLGHGLAADLAIAYNEIAERQQHLTSELGRVQRVAGREGRHSERLEAGVGEGGWAKAIDAANNLVSDLVRPTGELARVVAAVSEGDLTQRMDVALDGQPLRGEPLKLARSVNGLVDQLSGISHEITRVTREVGTEGKLGGQARVRNADGSWRDLIDAVNAMSSRLTRRCATSPWSRPRSPTATCPRPSPSRSPARWHSSRAPSTGWSTSCRPSPPR